MKTKQQLLLDLEKADALLSICIQSVGDARISLLDMQALLLWWKLRLGKADSPKRSRKVNGPGESRSRARKKTSSA